VSEEVKTRWSSRKFWSAMIWQAVFTVMFGLGVLPEEAFVALTYLLLGGYFVSNTSQHIMSKR